MLGTVLGLVALVLLSTRLVYVFRNKKKRKAEAAEFLFADVTGSVEDPSFEQIGADEFPRLSGTYKGFPVQIYPLVDTLAVRRLPALWLMVTLQDSLPVKAHFDLMMRPAGTTTFSNFDRLPHTVKLHEGFPEHAIVRTDNISEVLPASLIAPHLESFFGPRAKELLITPNGLRIVWLLAEADRARYGVLRQAEFGQVQIDSLFVRNILDRLIAIRKDILDWTMKTL
jgi:hypothetical protein